MTIKQSIMRTVFCLEILAFCWWYVWGTQGVIQQRIIAQERDSIVNNIQTLRTEIAQLKRELVRRQGDELYKERVAREQLQMARDGDIIYFIE